MISLEECRKLKKALEVQLVGDDSSCSYDNSDFLPSVLVPHWNVHMCERDKVRLRVFEVPLVPSWKSVRSSVLVRFTFSVL